MGSYRFGKPHCLLFMQEIRRGENTNWEESTMEYSSVNTIWVLLGAALVFFMQAGFSMCEAGFTRAKTPATS